MNKRNRLNSVAHCLEERTMLVAGDEDQSQQQLQQQQPLQTQQQPLQIQQQQNQLHQNQLHQNQQQQNQQQQNQLHQNQQQQKQQQQKQQQQTQLQQNQQQQNQKQLQQNLNPKNTSPTNTAPADLAPADLPPSAIPFGGAPAQMLPSANLSKPNNSLREGESLSFNFPIKKNRPVVISTKGGNGNVDLLAGFASSGGLWDNPQGQPPFQSVNDGNNERLTLISNKNDQVEFEVFANEASNGFSLDIEEQAPS